MPTVPTTIIAGSGGPRVSWLPYGDRHNDGVMSVQDTYLGSGVEVIDVPKHSYVYHVNFAPNSSAYSTYFGRLIFFPIRSDHFPDLFIFINKIVTTLARFKEKVGASSSGLDDMPRLPKFP